LLRQSYEQLWTAGKRLKVAVIAAMRKTRFSIGSPLLPLVRERINLD
jgi:hypothetical protein